MALNSNNGVNDDQLTSALINVLGLVDENKPSKVAVRRSANRHAAHDAASDSSLGLLYGQASEEEVVCRSCGAVCSRSDRYCGACAAYIANYTEKHEFEQIELRPISLNIGLVAINEDSSDGARIPLNFNETILGRSGDSRFPSDAFLSPHHARLIVDENEGSLSIEDLDSLNGTFIRVRGEVQLNPGDCFLAGRQLLRFERFEQPLSTKAKASDGTRYMGSPPSGGDFKLVQIGIGNITQNIYCLSEAGANFGREQGDIVFNKDRFMSGRHAQIYPRDDGRYYLNDLHSSNGTWFRINKRCRLYHGDLIFLGQQLFRIDSSDIM